MLAVDPPEDDEPLPRECDPPGDHPPLLPSEDSRGAMSLGQRPQPDRATISLPLCYKLVTAALSAVLGSEF